MNEEKNVPLDSRKKLQLWLLLLIIPVGVLSYVLVRKNSATVPTNAPIATNLNSNESSAVVAEPVVPNSVYKNGTYSADGEYFSPGGPELIGVSVTLADDIVTATDLTVQSERPISLKFQEVVRDSYKQYVIGKKIDDIKLTKISGSSLTPVGFNDAIEKIKAEAKS